MRIFPNAAVASPHYLATSAGVGVLQRGGNAVDAAIATNLVLAVVCPHLCGVGGDLFAMVYGNGEVHGLNSSGRLPQAARLPEDGKVPERGIGSVTVPGAVAGWLALANKFGTIDIQELARPAIRYAREGFTPAPSLQRSLAGSLHLLDEESQRVFGSPKIVNTDLADVLEDLGSFYQGPVATRAPTPFTAKDFSDHRAEWVEPLSGVFMGRRIYEMPPNSRGHLVLKALEMMEPLDGLSEDDPEFHLRMIRAIETATLSGDTVYLCAWDEFGMGVSINESNYMGFGSGVMVPGTGVHLHNRGAYHTSETYKGGAKPIHTLAPALATHDGELEMLFGTMGGEAQIQIHLQLLARTFVLGQDPQTAVSAPRWVKHGVGQLLAEEGLPYMEGAETIPLSDVAGHAHIIRLTEKGLAAGADPRADSLGAGY